ncbi:MAG: hypothetical protein ACT4OS_07855 [Acidimicrobiales bacterium]
MERVYLDTNVLFPMTIMDLMLSMAEDFHHDLVWNDFLLEEWERVIVREKHRTPEQARAITDAIRQAFPTGRIAPEDYEAIIETIPGSDPDDRVHGAWPRSPAARPRSLPPTFGISTSASSTITASWSRPPRAISSDDWGLPPMP